jgi:hypothetical protein
MLGRKWTVGQRSSIALTVDVQPGTALFRTGIQRFPISSNSLPLQKRSTCRTTVRKTAMEKVAGGRTAMECGDIDVFGTNAW